MVTEFSIVVTLVEMLLIGKEQEGALWAAGNVYILLADNYTAVFICKYPSSCSHNIFHLIYCVIPQRQNILKVKPIKRLFPF